MEPEEILRDLEAAKQLAEQSQHDMRKLITTVTDYASKMITEIYADDLLTMESKGFRDIEDILSRYIVGMAGDVDDAVFNNQVAPQP